MADAGYTALFEHKHTVNAGIEACRGAEIPGGKKAVFRCRIILAERRVERHDLLSGIPVFGIRYGKVEGKEFQDIIIGLQVDGVEETVIEIPGPQLVEHTVVKVHGIFERHTIADSGLFIPFGRSHLVFSLERGELSQVENHFGQ